MVRLSQEEYTTKRGYLLGDIQNHTKDEEFAREAGDRKAEKLSAALRRKSEAELDVLDAEQEAGDTWPKYFEITVYNEYDEDAAQFAQDCGFGDGSEGYDKEYDPYQNVAAAAYSVALVFTVDAEGHVNLVGAWTGNNGVGEHMPTVKNIRQRRRMQEKSGGKADAPGV
jgi:hypothetical protein